MRTLKHHERKLLKKVDFMKYKSDDTLRENAILHRYRVQDRADYIAYNRLSGRIGRITALLATLPPTDPFRQRITALLVDKLYRLGVIPTRKSLTQTEKLPASAFCRRRLPVVLCRLRMAEGIEQAVTLVEQGHIRIGPETVTDPAFLVTRANEDFVTWTDRSKIRQKIDRYNNALDDFDHL